MLILDVVDIKVLLALVRVDRVQLEEVLPTNSTTESIQPSQQYQHHSCGKYRNNISTPSHSQIPISTLLHEVTATPTYYICLDGEKRD